MWNSIVDIVALVSGIIGIITGIIGLRLRWKTGNEADVPTLTQRNGNRLFVFGVIVVVFAALMVASPGHVSVSVTGSKDGDFHFEQTGFGGQDVHFKKGDMVLKSSTR